MKYRVIKRHIKTGDYYVEAKNLSQKEASKLANRLWIIENSVDSMNFQYIVEAYGEEKSKC